jgi:predicted enzyme related to lactoylglutathione lyase
MDRKPIGSFGWFDLTVDDATSLKDFYAEVAGWKVSEFDMGGYSDYVMSTPDADGAPGEAVGGICHARGGNASQPQVWMNYIVVPDVEKSLAAACARGGKARTAVRSAGGGKYVVIEDPAGACVALYQYD